MATIPKSIYEKRMSDGSTHIMVRFTHGGITYPVKNFTKLFGCEKRSDAKSKLEEVKLLLSQNKDPFSKSLETFAEIYENKLNTNEANGTWAYYTVKNRRHFFNRYIKKNERIGRKKVEKITYDDINSLLTQFGDKSSSRNTAIDILRPVFNEAFDKGIIFKNLMKSDAFKKLRYATKLEIETRAKTNQVNIIKGLYEAIPLYDSSQAIHRNVEMHKAFLYLLVMTAHRSGEIIQLKKEDIDLEEKKINAPESITKTKGGYQYPLPDEVYEYVKKHKGGLLFPSPQGGSIDRVFKRLVDLAEIKLAENHQISGHDTRRLLMSVMVEELGIDSNIADYCLKHKKGGVMAHYLHLSYKTKEKTFKKYWNFLRNKAYYEADDNANIIDNQISVNIENNKKNNTQIEKPNKEKEELDMAEEDKLNLLERYIKHYESGYITKEQFDKKRDILLNS